jgi:hypothetical protein
MLRCRRRADLEKVLAIPLQKLDSKLYCRAPRPVVTLPLTWWERTSAKAIFFVNEDYLRAKRHGAALKGGFWIRRPPPGYCVLDVHPPNYWDASSGVLFKVHEHEGTCPFNHILLLLGSGNVDCDQFVVRLDLCNDGQAWVAKKYQHVPLEALLWNAQWSEVIEVKEGFAYVSLNDQVLAKNEMSVVEIHIKKRYERGLDHLKFIASVIFHLHFPPGILIYQTLGAMSQVPGIHVSRGIRWVLYMIPVWLWTRNRKLELSKIGGGH